MDVRPGARNHEVPGEYAREVRRGARSVLFAARIRPNLSVTCAGAHTSGKCISAMLLTRVVRAP